MREKQRITVPFELKKFEDKEGAIEGYGAVFNNVDHGFDKIEPGAFKKALRGKKSMPMLWQHSSDEPIGKWSEFTEDDHGLLLAGNLNLSRDSGQADVPNAWKARALLKQGAISGLSIGFYALDFRFEKEVRVLTEIDVIETSLATFPMNPLARVSNVKSMTNRDFVQIVREAFNCSRGAAEACRHGGFKAMKDYCSGESGSDSDDKFEEVDTSELKQSLDRLQSILRGNGNG